MQKNEKRQKKRILVKGKGKFKKSYNRKGLEYSRN